MNPKQANSYDDQNDKDYISNERENLFSRIKDIDKRLGDFKELLIKSMNYHADYSPDGLKYVELLLMQIKTDEEDADLLIDSALYIGETIRRTFNAKWDISEIKDLPDHYGQPVITGNISQKDFFPFLEIKNFTADPVIGYFNKLIQPS